MDEFQFKPLTDGLGFQKRKKNISVQAMTEEFNLTPPLPRRDEGPTHRPESIQTPATHTVDEILKTLNQNRKLYIEESETQTSKKAQKSSISPTTLELSAGLLDGMLVVALSLLSLIATLMITKVDLAANLLNPDSQYLVYIALVSLFAGTTWIYFTLTRVFMGSTAGEWVFDQFIGKPQDWGKPSFALRVALRSVLVIATGFITLPILSTLFRTDIAGYITGARLHKRTHG